VPDYNKIKCCGNKIAVNPFFKALTTSPESSGRKDLRYLESYLY
jgi:hypothetical protein